MSMWLGNSQNGIRFPETENFILKVSGHYFFKETDAHSPGLNYKIEAGYTGKIYALLGFESFPNLKGGMIDGKQLDGYFSFHGAIGFNLVHGYEEQWHYNAGIRPVIKAYRGGIDEGRYRTFIGWEAGVTWFINGGDLGVGLSGAIDNRKDQEIFDWPVEHKFSSFVVFIWKIKRLKAK